MNCKGRVILSAIQRYNVSAPVGPCIHSDPLTHGHVEVDVCCTRARLFYASGLVLLLLLLLIIIY